MDLNQTYFQQQLAVMRADSAEDDAARVSHQLVADRLAQRIECHQIQLGAAAACGWTARRAAAAVGS